MIKVESCVLSVLFLLTESIQKVIAETCSNGKVCYSPYKCCEESCCKDDDDDDYVYGYRMSFWNLWYFWFIILFVLMSCFGGCGYYKQRQRIIRGRTGSPARANRRSRTIILTATTGETNASYAYSGPGADPYNNVYQPPPYSEVMLHPGLYPINKENLPPYPGGNNQERTDPVPINDVVLPQPPPYTEIANQNADLNQTAYQNTAHLQANQNAGMNGAANQNTAHLQQQVTSQNIAQESNHSSPQELPANQNVA